MKQLSQTKTLFILLFAMLVILTGCTVNTRGDSNLGTGFQASPDGTEASATQSLDSENTGSSIKEGYNEGEKMPDFNVDTIDGDTFTLSEHEGKIVFINLFATWCGPCMGEMPDIKDLFDNYKDKVDFILVNVWEDKATAASFSEGNGFTCPVGYVEGDHLGGYMVEFIPQTFILGPDGVIEYYAAGASDYESFNNVIERLLKEQE